MYADIGPLSNDRPRHSESASEDNLEHRVEYAQLNHKAQNSKPLSSVDNPTTEGTILHNGRAQNHSGQSNTQMFS